MLGLLLFATTVAFLFSSATCIPTNGFCFAEKKEDPEPDSNEDISSGEHTLAVQISVPAFSERDPVANVLFGRFRHTIAVQEELSSTERPRVVFGENEWDLLLSRYVDVVYYNTPGSWSHSFREFTLDKGPTSWIITNLSLEEKNADGLTSNYDPTKTPFNSNEKEFSSYRASLKPIARYLREEMNPLRSISFFLCAFWAEVMELANDNSAGQEVHEKCITAVVSWAKILLAHRVHSCFPSCPTAAKRDREGKFLWNSGRPWDIYTDYYSAGSSLALAYDILHIRMDETQRRTVRSALALLVLNRHSWGNSQTSSPKSPNAKLNPHRIFSYRALLHSGLYLTNLAIEGETDFDEYTTSILSRHASRGFNTNLHERFTAMIEAYVRHGIYPDGSTLEDGQTYFQAFREGALGLIAAHRRGSNFLDTPQFRNFIHNAAQMTEPWACGKLLGHGSGGGNSFNTYVGLFKYAYPTGELPNMLWRQRFGNYKGSETCRTLYWQSAVQLAFLGGEHYTNSHSPEGLGPNAKEAFKLSYYAARRGLLIARGSHSEEASYLHFDARPDAFLTEHSSADRGVLTFSALGQAWIVDLPWKENAESYKHSILHVDGIAQADKAPSVRMLRVTDKRRVVLAVADLTYAYNTQWGEGGDGEEAPEGYVAVYSEDGISSKERVEFDDEENSSPWRLGWPEDDQKSQDIGFTDATILHGVDDIGSKGLWLWKRQLRDSDLLHVVRSVGLIRSTAEGPGIAFFVDSADGSPGAHVFESYLILSNNVNVLERSSSCRDAACKITVQGQEDAILELHFSSLSSSLSFRVDKICADKKCQAEAQRLAVRSTGLSAEEIWVLLCPHWGAGCQAAMSRLEVGVSIQFEGSSHRLKLDPGDRGAVLMEIPPMKAMTELVSFRNHAFDDSFLSTNSDEFLHRTEAPLQMVFNVTSVSGDGAEDQDEIRTCSFHTRMKTSIAVYDCGSRLSAARNYRKRQCTFISETTRLDCCSRASQQSRWIGKLKHGRMYYVAVFGYPIPGETPKLTVIHLRRRISGLQFPAFK